MTKRLVALLGFAFFVAVGASFVLHRLVFDTQAVLAPAPTVRLVLAAHDLEPGTIIREGDVVLKDWVGEAPPTAARLFQDIVGRGVITRIYAKEPILENRLAPKGAGGGFAATIPQGMQAVAVPVNEVVGVTGFAVAGMHVDVITSGTPPNGTGGLGTKTQTLLQNIEVLSAGQDFRKDGEGKPVAVQVVNLLVAPEQAEQLSIASHQTTIQLVVRNPLDSEVPKAPLFPADVPPQPQPNTPARRGRHSTRQLHPCFLLPISRPRMSWKS